MFTSRAPLTSKVASRILQCVGRVRVRVRTPSRHHYHESRWSSSRSRSALLSFEHLALLYIAWVKTSQIQSVQLFLYSSVALAARVAHCHAVDGEVCSLSTLCETWHRSSHRAGVVWGCSCLLLSRELNARTAQPVSEANRCPLIEQDGGSAFYIANRCPFIEQDGGAVNALRSPFMKLNTVRSLNRTAALLALRSLFI